ncbi:MAG: IRE (iron responsive element) [Pirellulaceae bacterium]
MIRNVSFQRKVLYLCGIALLLFPLYMIGRPATSRSNDGAGDANARPGGTLARLRVRYDLSQAELGDIDPASESMKLATLGMRGVAANILWSKANEYKRTENWEALIATVNQMARLQPNFISVWEFQSHNLSYNISVEHDDYRFRYHWVKKGIEYLIKGVQYNRNSPRLFWTLGWYTGQKFGRADEHKQFRVLFRDDEDFHNQLKEYVNVDEARGAYGDPDNWLVSRLWYLRAYNLVDRQGAPLRGKSPHIFFADGPKSWMNYAAAIESEGILDEQAEYAWSKGGEEWKAYGKRLVPTSWGVNIRLGDLGRLRAEVQKLRVELDELIPGGRNAVVEEKKAKLTDAQRAALAKNLTEIDDEAEYRLHWKAVELTAVSDREVAQHAPTRLRAKANRLASDAMAADENAERVERYRSNVNYAYWATRCRVEQLPETVAARRHVFAAKDKYDKGELEAAEIEYNKAWDLWAKIVFQDNPELVQQLMADDLFEDVEQYVRMLGQLEKRLPADFKLMPLLEKFGEIPDDIKPKRGAAPKAKSSDNADAEPPAPEAKSEHSDDPGPPEKAAL